MISNVKMQGRMSKKGSKEMEDPIQRDLRKDGHLLLGYLDIVDTRNCYATLSS